MKLVRLSDFSEVKVGDILRLTDPECKNYSIKGENTILVAQIVEPKGMGRFYPNMIGALPPEDRGYLKHHYSQEGGYPSWRQTYPHIYGCVWVLDEVQDGRYHQILINYLHPNCDIRYIDYSGDPRFIHTSLLHHNIVTYSKNFEATINEYLERRESSATKEDFPVRPDLNKGNEGSEPKSY